MAVDIILAAPSQKLLSGISFSNRFPFFIRLKKNLPQGDAEPPSD